jgi:hypothetical protein
MVRKSSLVSHKQIFTPCALDGKQAKVVLDQVKCPSSPNSTRAEFWVLHVPCRESTTREPSQMAVPTGPIHEP